MTKMKAAIVGCGSIFSLHANALHNSDFAEIVAVCDIDVNRASVAADKYQCAYFTDYNEMLKTADFDVVHICTPHYLHKPMAIAAMRSGKNVFTEKPISISSSDAEEMISVSVETGKRLGVCFQNRYNNTSVKLKEILESDKLGRILGAKAFVTWQRGEDYYIASGWRGTWDKEGGGVLINQAIHTLDLLQWFLGDIEKLKGTADTRLLGKVIEVEDTAEATIVFKNGAIALFYATNCYVTNSPIEIEIICEKAQIKLTGDLTVLYNDGEVETVPQIDVITGAKSYWGSGHSSIIYDFYNRLLNGKEIPVDGRQGITAIKMIEAIYKSSKTGVFVEF